jgi:hypothetical protein
VSHQANAGSTSTLVATNANDYNDGLSQLNNRIQLLESALRAKNESLRVSSSSSVLTLSDPNNDDHVQFQSDIFETPGMTHKGALTWASLLRKDKFLNSIVISMKNRKRIVVNEISGPKHNNDFSKVFIKHIEHEAPLNESDDLSVVSMVKEFLKDNKLVWILVDKYFESELEVMFPILQKDEFESEVVQIIGPRGSINGVVNFTRTSQCAAAGILLMVMRLASLPYIIQDLGHRVLTKDEDYIVMNPVSEAVMKGVNRCMEEVVNLKHASLRVFQMILLKRYYELISPEEADCLTIAPPGGLGQLLHHGIECSLNRDPEKVCGKSTVPKNVTRRLWYMVVHLDLHQMMTVGAHSIVTPNMYDTELPHLDESETPLDFGIDKLIVDFAKLHDICYPLLNYLLDVRNPPRLAELLTRLRPLEDYISSLPTIEQIVARPDETAIQRVQKIKSLTQLINCISLLSMIYYHIFLHYSAKMDRERSFHYIIQVIKLGSLLYPLVLFFDDSKPEYDLHKNFGYSPTLIPTFEMCLHRLQQLMMSIMARFKIYKLTVRESDPSKIALIDKTGDLINVSMKHILKVYCAMSGNYFHAWVVARVHTFIVMKVMELQRGCYVVPTPMDLETIATFNSTGKDDVFFHWTSSELQELYNAFLPYQEIDIQGSMTDSPVNFNGFNEKDKRWLDQVLQDFNRQELNFIDAKNGDVGTPFSTPFNFNGYTSDGSVPSMSMGSGQTPTTTTSADASNVLDTFLTDYELEEYFLRHSTGYGLHL